MVAAKFEDLLHRSWRFCQWIFALIFLCLMPQQLAAQSVSTTEIVEAGSGSPIPDLSCGYPATQQFQRTFTITDDFIVGDVDLGVVIAHTYRSDLKIYLTSPKGTMVTIMNWSVTNQLGDNVSQRFDDEAGQSYTERNRILADALTSPYYYQSFRPHSPLSAFDGEHAKGNWVIRICDAVMRDSGSFRRAMLALTPINLTQSLEVTVLSDPANGTLNPKMVPGALVQYCTLVSNQSNSVAPSVAAPVTNITVIQNVPDHITLDQNTLLAGGACDSATSTDGVLLNQGVISGVAASLPAGQAYALVFRGTVN